MRISKRRVLLSHFPLNSPLSFIFSPIFSQFSHQPNTTYPLDSRLRSRSSYNSLLLSRFEFLRLIVLRIMDTPFPNLESSSDPSSSSSLDASRKKRRKIDTGASSGGQATAEILSNRAKWRSDASQRIYSSKLVDALRRARRSSSSPAAGGTRLVRETADRVLAVAARGRSRWSRAILSRRLSRSKNHRKARIGTAAAGATKITARCRADPAAARRLPAVEKKVRVLGRLVPGCRKLPFPSLLDEASDYIAALEMQVRAMTALTELLAGGGASGSGGAR